MKKNNFILLLLCLFSLSSCVGDACIDADDFGFQTFNVSSTYTPDQLQSQVEGHEVAPWLNSGYTVNGRTLTMLIRTWVNGVESNTPAQVSAWCPWYGPGKSPGALSTFCSRLRDCQFIDGQMCSTTNDALIINPPCLLRDGIGLYALIAQPNTNPNESFISERNPKGITFHLGEPLNGYNLYDIGSDGTLRTAGGRVYQYSGKDSNTYAGSPLYFKILDKFYEDNNGQYRVVIKSGINDNRPDPIQFLTLLVRQNLFGINGNNATLSSASYNQIVDQVNATGPTTNVNGINTNSQIYKGANTNSNNGIIPNIYMNIVGNPGYTAAVYGMLCLYIMFTALSYLVGNINITNTELITRVFKFSIVSVLLSSTNAWMFFHDYLFVYFVEGVSQILGMVQDAGATGPGSASLLGLMVAPQTQAKLWSLLFSEWSGFIYIILFLIALYFIIMMTFEAAILYLTSLIAVGMIIVMAPIFICFLLFKITRSLFDNWLKQLISYAIQPIILFTGLALISIIIRAELYSSLGFRVCKHDFPNLGAISALIGGGMPDLTQLAIAVTAELITETGLIDANVLTQSIFYWWFPNPMSSDDFSRTQAIIPVPVDHFQSNDTFCAAYSCFENRYIELPFLDPVQDITRINNFFAGNFVQFDGLFIIFVAVYLLSKFNETSVSISKFLSNSSANFADAGKSSKEAFNYLDGKIGKGFDIATEPIRKPIRELANKFSDRVGEGYENFHMNRLRNQALGSSANPAIQEEVKKNYGIDPKQVTMDATEQYRKALQDTLQDLNPEHKLDVDNLADGKFSDLKDAFSTAKFGEGKKYSNLDEKEKEQIDKALTSEKDGKTLKDFSVESIKTKEYQNAYANAHQDMSERGIGMFGKRIAPLRALEELDHTVNTNKQLKEDKRQQIGENLYSGYEGIKRKLAVGAIGEKNTDRLGIGSSWHSIDTKDSRLRTYDEILKDKEKQLEYSELRKQINKEVVRAREDILKPENFAKLESRGEYETLKQYKLLAQAEIKHQVHSALTQEWTESGVNHPPIIMGEKFMREKATDLQLKEMIDNSKKAQDKLFDTNKYTSKSEYYSTMNDKALRHIQEKYNELKTQVDLTGVDLKDLPELYGQYRALNGTIKHDNISPGQLKQLSLDYLKENAKTDSAAQEREAKGVAEVQNLFSEFNSSAAILSHINERKEQIAQEITKHVSEINTYRKESKMTEYKPEWLQKQSTSLKFSVRSMDDSIKR